MSNLHPMHKINKLDDVTMHVLQPFLPVLKLAMSFPMQLFNVACYIEELGTGLGMRLGNGAGHEAMILGCLLLEHESCIVGSQRLV